MDLGNYALILWSIVRPVGRLYIGFGCQSSPDNTLRTDPGDQADALTAGLCLAVHSCYGGWCAVFWKPIRNSAK